MPPNFQKPLDRMDNDPGLRELNHVAAPGSNNVHTVRREGGQTFLSFLPFGIDRVAGHSIIPTTAHNHQRRIPKAAESIGTSFFRRRSLVGGHFVRDGKMARAAQIQRHLFTARFVRNTFEWVEATGK